MKGEPNSGHEQTLPQILQDRRVFELVELFELNVFDTKGLDQGGEHAL